jgi:hypothetical protein
MSKPDLITYELWQGGICVALASAPSQDVAATEIAHYAMMYGQDGPVEIKGPFEEMYEDDEP